MNIGVYAGMSSTCGAGLGVRFVRQPDLYWGVVFEFLFFFVSIGTAEL